MTELKRSFTVQEILEKHPAPWAEQIFPDGRVVISDATGREVALLEITRLVTLITRPRKDPT